MIQNMYEYVLIVHGFEGCGILGKPKDPKARN